MRVVTSRRRFAAGAAGMVGVAAAALVYVFVVKDARGPSAAAADPQPTPSAAAATSPAADAKKDGKEADDKAKAPVPVSVAAVATGPVSSYLTATANLVPENDVKVLAEAEGRVAELLVEEGMRVARGQILASLVKDDAEIAFRKAQLKAQHSALAFERAEKMSGDNLMSRETYDKTRMDHDIAHQELAEAKWRLDKTTIRAPFGGRVTDRLVKPGQHVRPGDVLFSVADFDPLIARIYVPEKDVFGLREGRDVRITLKADGSTSVRGRIRQISPIVDVATGTVKLTIEAAAPPAIVRPGAFVTIDIVRETRPRAVLLPREAVIRELQDAYVFVAREGAAVKRPVSLGLEEGRVIEATTGVQAGDQVIVAGQGNLKDGQAIKILPDPAAAAPASAPVAVSRTGS